MMLHRINDSITFIIVVDILIRIFRKMVNILYDMMSFRMYYTLQFAFVWPYMVKIMLRTFNLLSF